MNIIITINVNIIINIVNYLICIINIYITNVFNFINLLLLL